MSDDIRAMTAQLARDPSSLVFLPLGEALRKRGQLDAALTVATRGANRYPEVAEAHDLIARIRADRGEGDAAFDAWTQALTLDPDHLGALKGLAFLFYRSGDARRSLKHLIRALEVAPGDASLTAAAERIRRSVAEQEDQAEAGVAPVPAVEPMAPIPEPIAALPEAKPTPDSGPALLLDTQGRVLRGQAPRADGSDAGDAVAAVLAGVSREVDRVVRLLELGECKALALEGGPANYEIRTPSPETVLLVYRPRGVPAGQLSRIADRAVTQARVWLESFE